MMLWGISGSGVSLVAVRVVSVVRARARGCSECITGTISVRPSAILSEVSPAQAPLRGQGAGSNCSVQSGTQTQTAAPACTMGSRLAAKYSLVCIESVLTRVVLFRMRAKTSEFLKVLNRAKIEEETKKKGLGNRGAKSPFI